MAHSPSFKLAAQDRFRREALDKRDARDDSGNSARR
jgi:hypothetical protein